MAALILTLVGPDRPGLIGLVSEQVAAHGGSWLESRLAHLGGQFTGIVLIEVADPAVEALTRSLAASCDDGLTIIVHPAPGSPALQASAALMLDLVCQDRPGIVRDVTRVLASSGVNIEELTTDIDSASFSGEHMFHARARLRLLPGTSADTLRERLEQLGEELMVDMTLTENLPG